MISKFVKVTMIVFVIRPLAWFILGLNLRTKTSLPKRGPAVIVSNHNSHLDTFVLASLIPISEVSRLRLIAAADYFLKNRLVAWFYRVVFGMISIERGHARTGKDPLTEVYSALKENSIILFFPEGTRGEPEKRGELKKGIGYIAGHFPHVPIVPVFIYGAGRALPRGESLVVPFQVEMAFGRPIIGMNGRENVVRAIQEEFGRLAQTMPMAAWT